jgi:hypothetical protein
MARLVANQVAWLVAIGRISVKWHGKTLVVRKEASSKASNKASGREGKPSPMPRKVAIQGKWQGKWQWASQTHTGSVTTGLDSKLGDVRLYLFSPL